MRSDEAVSVYVRDYGTNTVERDIRKHFEDCGYVVKVDMFTNNGRFAFVEFSNGESARLAVERKHDSMMNGYRIFVKYSRKKHATSTAPPLPPPIPIRQPSPPPVHRPPPPTETPLSDTDPRSQWLFDHVDVLLTPSHHDGISSDIERQLRQTTSWFIADLQTKLGLPSIATITAQTYMNRFYMLHSFKSHDRFLVGSAALFLSAKINECSVKLTELTEKSLILADQLTNNPSPSELESVKKKIRQYEVILLNTLSYDVVVPQPFIALGTLLDQALLEQDFALNHIFNAAQIFISDAMAGPIAQQLTMEELAAGALYLSCVIHNMDHWLRSTTLFSHVNITSIVQVYMGMYAEHRSQLPSSLEALY